MRVDFIEKGKSHHVLTQTNTPHRLFTTLTITILLLFVGQIHSQPQKASGGSNEINLYLIGDTGDPQGYENDPILQTLKYHLENDGNRHSVIFLGDNIYSNGMPPEHGTSERSEAERRIKAALNVLKQTKTDAFLISGNHDWRNGVQGILAQEKFVENFSEGITDIRFEPSGGCPGPVSVTINEEWMILLLDSEWWIAVGPEDTRDLEHCETRTREELMSRINEVVQANEDKHIVVATHHPLYSDGPHGGYFTLKHHLFPLTELKPWLFLPLPGLGSLYPTYRRAGHSPQDISSSIYQRYIREILKATDQASGRIFVSGHEHSLALYDKGDHLAIVSGSGSKQSHLRKRNRALFSSGKNGFSVIRLKPGGDAEIEFWSPSDKAEGERLFRQAYDTYETADEELSASDIRVESGEPVDSTVVVQAGPKYEAGALKRWIWGAHYRETWTLPVEVPAIDLSQKNGGLDIVSVGGGQQSVSVVVADSAGRRGIMRSVQKDPSEALPEILRKTFANTVIQDQISASHPYGALAVSALADAAGVYQTAPEIGYLPETDGLDIPGTEKGALVYFEEFVSSDWFNRYYGGDAESVTDSDGAWFALRTHNKNRINEEQFLKSRLFDMLIGDWDRHDGQWFWVEIKENDGSVYEPVPIDRDNVFFKSDGLIPWLASRKWALRKFQHFDDDIRDIKGMNFNAQHLDRWFLNGLSRDEWHRIARDIKENITEEDIEYAIESWPEPVQELNRDEISRKLKNRLQKMEQFANRYYDILAKEVRVFGSNEKEYFKIERRASGNVFIEMADFSDNEMGDIRYKREIFPDETKEIHIYGFDGDDQFKISGVADQSIIIRLIPGEGTDSVQDHTRQDNGSKGVFIYDTYNGVDLNVSSSTRLHFSDNRNVHRYDRESFQYNYAGPLLAGGFNPDDGMFLGAGTRIIRHGFRKNPYASMHEFSAKHALQSSAFSFDLKNRFTERVGNLDLRLDATVLAPNFKANYFGLGNETEQLNESRSFYRFRMDQVRAKALLVQRLSSITEIEFGPEYAFYSPSETPDRFVSSKESGLVDEDFKGHHYGVFSASFLMDGRDNDVVPFYGFRLDTGVSFNIGLNDRSTTFTKVHGEGSLYYTFERYRTTLATRVGGAVNTDSFDFFRANTLGGNVLLGDKGKLRGFLRDRFAGRSSFYHNIELRNRLIDFQTYFFPASLGILGFMDQGRVWIGEEKSDKWHRGYGGGIWITPFRRAVITATFSFSDEYEIFSVNTGFSF